MEPKDNDDLAKIFRTFLHDVSTPLQAASAFLDMAMAGLDKNSAINESKEYSYVKRARKSLDKLAVLVTQQREDLIEENDEQQDQRTGS